MVPLALFTTAVPLPFGALGLSEGISGQLFEMVHHADGAIAMMAFRILMYGSGAVSACVYLANLRQVRTLERGSPARWSRRRSTRRSSTRPSSRKEVARLIPAIDSPADRLAGEQGVDLPGEDLAGGDADVDGPDDPLGSITTTNGIAWTP